VKFTQPALAAQSSETYGRTPPGHRPLQPRRANSRKRSYCSLSAILRLGGFCAVFRAVLVFAIEREPQLHRLPYFEETKIPAVKRSGHVDIYLMSGGSPLRGHVESISRGITDRDRSGP
jgi:hypothetical protein